jgi:hypothetical protein
MPGFTLDTPHAPAEVARRLSGRGREVQGWEPSGRIERRFSGPVTDGGFSLQRNRDGQYDWVVWRLDGRIEPRDTGSRLVARLRPRLAALFFPLVYFGVFAFIGVQSWRTPDPRLSIDDWQFALGASLVGVVVFVALAWRDARLQQERLRDALASGVAY